MKLFTIFISLTIIYVTLDFFTGDSEDIDLQNFRISLPALDTDKAYFFKAGNKQIVIVRYSEVLQQMLKVNTSNQHGYFVAYAFGTYLGCPLEVVDNQYLKESCSSASYDFAGRPVNSQNFTSLMVPVYNFCHDFSCINLRL